MKLRSIALVAHDSKKKDIVEWAKFNYKAFNDVEVFATGTTGTLLEKELNDAVVVNKLVSGPLGGDQQLGALIVEKKVDMIIFFWDPLEMQPHDTDVKALLRLAMVWNIPVACNRATADFLISSPLMDHYEKIEPDYTGYINRFKRENRAEQMDI